MRNGLGQIMLGNRRDHLDRVGLAQFSWVVLGLALLNGCLVSSGSDPAKQLSPNEVCTRQHCAEEMMSCESSDSCWSRIKCLVNCTANDTTCREACQSPEGGLDTPSLELDICRSHHCQDTSDTCGSGMFDGRGAICAQCAQQKCCSEATKCAGDFECARVMHNRNHCDNPFCWRNDGLGYSATREPLASAERLALDNCMKSCGDDCRVGTDYDCLFQYAPPGTHSDAVLIPAPIDLLTRSPIADVELELYAINGGSAELIQKQTFEVGKKIRFEITGQKLVHLLASHPSYLKTRFVPTRPVAGVEQWTLPLANKSLISLAEKMLDFKADLENRGMLFVSAKDCTANPGRDMIVAVTNTDSETAWAYTAGPTIDPDAEATDNSGFATYFNMPVGKTAVSLTHGPTEKAMATAFAEIRAGVVTWLAVFPSAL